MGIAIGGIVALTILPFGLIAIAFAWYAQKGKNKLKASENWFMTNAQVLHSQVEARRSSDSDGGYSTSYYPVIVYTYQFNGQMFQSDRVTLGMEVGYGSHNKVVQQIAQYPVGAVVPVYVNPDNPAEATLLRTAPGSNILMWVAGCMVLSLLVTAIFMAGMAIFVDGMVSSAMP